MANIIPPLVSSSPPPMDSDDEDDDDFGDFANANDFSSYDCDVLESSLPSSPPHVHKPLDFPGDPSRDPFRDDCPTEKNDPKDNTSQDSVVSIVTSDSGLSSEINLSSGDDAPVENIAATVRTDVGNEKLNGDLSVENEQIVDRIFVSDLKNSFEKNENELDANVISNGVNGEIFDFNNESFDEKTVFKNLSEITEMTRNESESVIDNSDSLVIQDSTISDMVDSKSQYMELSCDDKTLNSLEVFKDDIVCETLENCSKDVEINPNEEFRDLDEFDTFQVAEINQTEESSLRQNNSQTDDMSEKDFEDSDYNNFNSFVDFQNCQDADNERSEIKNTQVDDFAEFSSANFEETETITAVIPIDKREIDKTIDLDLVEDDFDDFAGFETAPSVVKASDDFTDFNVGSVVSDLDPIEVLKNDRKKFSEAVVKTISKSFASSESTNICDIPTRDLLKTGALWQYIEDVENTRAFQYQWDASRSCEALLGALNIDTRNILQRGGKIGVGVPRFAAYLGSDPLEPSPVVQPVSAPVLPLVSAPAEVPAAQFDWNDAGLVNPLDRTTKTNPLEQLPSEEPPASEVIKHSNTSDDDSVNSLKLGDYDPEPPVQQQSETQVSDSDDDFTDFRSCTEPVTAVKLRETHISSKDSSPAWLQPTILTPELARKSDISSEPEPIQNILDPIKNVSDNKELSTEEIKSANDDDDFADFQSVPLKNISDSVQNTQKETATISNTFESSLNIEKTLVPIAASVLPLKPEILRPIKKEPVIEINWPDPGVINDEPIGMIEIPSKSIISHDIESKNMSISNCITDLTNASTLNHITDPVISVNVTFNDTCSTDLPKVIKNQVDIKSDSIESLKLQKDKTKPVNSINTFKPENKVNRTIDDEDWSDFVSVRTDTKLVPSIVKNDNLQKKSSVNTLDINSLSFGSQYTKSNIIAPIKNDKDVQLKEVSSKKTSLKPDILTIPSTSQNLNSERYSLQNDILKKVTSNTYNIPNQGFKTDKPNDQHQNYNQYENITVKKSSKPFMPSNQMNIGLKPNKIDSKRQNHVQQVQQSSSEDDWSDFVSSGQPTVHRFNTKHSPPKFSSWNTPAVPNIITNPAHFEMYRAPADDIPRSHSIRPGSNSISTISSLPDLDFMTPGGMIWPRSSSSSSKK